MPRVAVMTAGAVYQGELELVSPTGQVVRFVDALNHPNHLKAHGQRAGSYLELLNAVRRYGDGRVVSCGPLVGIRPGEILAAYEMSLESDEERGAKQALVYEQAQQTRDPRPVFVILENGFRFTAEVSGGLNTLDLAREGRHFVPCRSVRLMPPGSDTALELDTLFVNALRIESSGPESPW